MPQFSWVEEVDALPLLMALAVVREEGGPALLLRRACGSSGCGCGVCLSGLIGSVASARLGATSVVSRVNCRASL